MTSSKLFWFALGAVALIVWQRHISGMLTGLTTSRAD